MGANAQTSVPAFTAGQVLTAAQVTGINTGIPVFASSTERDAAFGGTGEKTLAEGQMAYLEDTNATQYYDGSSWAAVAGGKILQVVQTFVQGTFSTTSTSFVDVTGHTATITPSSATNKVYVIYTSALGHSTASRTRVMNLVRDGTNIAQPTAGGTPGTMNPWSDGISLMHVSCNFLDSPATTSPVVYKMQVKTDLGTLNVGNYSTIKVPSSLTLMEVSA